MAETYAINEVFYSLQGEGMRVGTSNIFIRFAGCNLACEMAPGPKSPGGFDCDTEFASGRKVTLDELYDWAMESIRITTGKDETDPMYGRWLILTGGEPALQVDKEFIDFWKGRGCKIAIESNGSLPLPDGWFDWRTISPKVAEHAIKQRYAEEVKYVRGYGQDIPKTVVIADNYLISPAFDGNSIHPKTLAWCEKLCLSNPKWRLSIQQHKLLQIR